MYSLFLVTLILNFLISTFALDTPQLNYTKYTTIQTNLNNIVGLKSTLDSQYLILIGVSQSGKNQKATYNGYTLLPVQNPSPFEIRIQTSIFFRSVSNQPCMLYSTDDNIVILRIFSDFYQSYSDQQLYKFRDHQVIRLAVSSDNSIWIASHLIKGIYFGKFSQPGTAQKVTHPNVYFYEQISWRPNSNHLLFCGAPYTDKQTSYLYLIDTQTLQNRQLIEASRFSDWEFLPSGKILIASQNHDTKNYELILFDIDTGEIKTQPYGKKLVLLIKMGSVIKTATSGDGWERYYFSNQDSYTKDNYFFKNRESNFVPVATILQSGAFTFNISATFPKQIEVYKMCNAEGYFFNEALYQCQLCHESCLNCIYKADACLSCIDDSYIFDEVEHSCTRPEVQSSNIWFFIVLGIFGGVVLIGIVFYVNRRYQKRRNKQLSSIISENMEDMEDYNTLK